MIYLRILTLCALLAVSYGCECGISLAPSPRIIMGTELQPHKYPWLVYLKIRDSWCGGSIIGRRTILTAGHCVYKPRDPIYDFEVRVYVGVHNVVRGLNSPLKVKEIVVHPKYEKRFDYDIAILKLASDIPYSAIAAPICIPKNDEENFKDLIIAGWGATDIDNRPAVPSVVDVEYIAPEKCDAMRVMFKSKYKTPEEVESQRSRHMCAFNTTTGGTTCKGDSGSPLQYRQASTGRHFVVGTVSVGLQNCPFKTFETLYSKVSAHRQFILDNTPDACLKPL